ncbi:UNVERIFIED_CONTAM: hypothetical protein Slati_2400100 [Sesamum latifolium]|uniref:Uncharacterized protein n=1 Tax=Sesamum latifolium TaxID=2727402 RepID=A0AAW2WEI4_9LAMI
MLPRSGLKNSILHKNVTLPRLSEILKLGLLDHRRTPPGLNTNDDPTLNSSSASKKTGSSLRKRKVTDGNDPVPKLMDMFSSFGEITNNCIGALTRVLETEFGDPEQRELILDAVRELNEFDENIHLKVARRLMIEPKEMELFFKLSKESRIKMVRMIVAGNF